MKRILRSLAILTLTLCLLLNIGCSPLIGLASVGSFGLGYLTAILNPQIQTTTEYYIDGVKVEDPAALGLE